MQNLICGLLARKMYSTAFSHQQSHSGIYNSVERPRRVTPGKRSVRKVEIRDQQRRWLRRVLDKTQKTPSQLAVESGLADVTLTRFLNREDYEGVLSPLTLRAIVEHTGLPGPDVELAPQLADMSRLHEVTRFDVDEVAPSNPLLASIVQRLTAESGLSPYYLHSSSLDAIGYLPGDVIMVDEVRAASPRDLVLAENAGELICRVYDPPVLTGATLRSTERPRALIVDDRTVRVIGRIASLVRLPAASPVTSPV